MMRKFIVFLIIVFSTACLHASSSKIHRLECTAPLQKTLKTARKLPEVEQLLTKVLADGPLYIKFNDHLSKQFEGYWDPNHRTIYITKNSNFSEADRITTMIFEMHNALRDNDFKKLDEKGHRREINQHNYVYSAEYIEYENALSTSNFLNIGVEKGIFPPECYWPVHDSFEEHFKLMELTGHAAWHANSYKRLS